MSHELTCIVSADYVRILVEGVWPSDKPRGIIDDIHDAWAKYPKLALLIDARHLRDIPSVIGDFKTAEHFAAVGFGRIGRIAVLDTLDHKDANEFLETAALNRGVNFQFFYTSEQEAVDWLLAKSGLQK